MSFKARVMNPVGWGAAIGAGLLATLTLLPQARGEVVFDEDQGPVEYRSERAPDARGEDRRVLRQAIGASERARVTRSAELPQPQLAQPRLAQPQAAPLQTVVVQPQAVAPAPAPVVVGEAAMAATVAEPAPMPLENVSKTELMRRERVREELRNEDAIQERLEQLRLRDEKRRSDQILKGDAMLPQAQVGQAVAAPALQEELVAAPVTERPGQGAGVAAAAGLNPALQNTAADPQASLAQAEPVTPDEDKTLVSVRPLGGMSNMNANGGFQVKPRYALGAALSILSSENLSFDLAYTYSEFGITAPTTNPLVAQVQATQAWQGYTSPETLGLKQNVVDAGLKLAMLGQASKIRPFVGGGAGYSKSFVNYTSGYTQLLDQYGMSNLSRDYDSSAFLGYVSTGFDVKVSKSVTLGGQFKYYGVLSSRENSQLSYNGFYTTPYYNPMLMGADADKRSVGASLSESSFYSILGTASFVF